MLDVIKGGRGRGYRMSVEVRLREGLSIWIRVQSQGFQERCFHVKMKGVEA